MAAPRKLTAPIGDVAVRFSRRARARRAATFRELLRPKAEDRLLDLGSEDGANIAGIVPFRENVWLADIDAGALARGREAFGFQTALLDESGRLPFADGEFDVVFCSSVIEHVTVDKGRLADYPTNQTFAAAAFERQRRFAEEVRRVGKRYFVQTPNRWFPVESHSWLPGVVILLPRRVQLRLYGALERFWPKDTAADFNLLTAAQMQELFPDAEIVRERALGLTKSLMAVKR